MGHLKGYETFIKTEHDWVDVAVKTDVAFNQIEKKAIRFGAEFYVRVEIWGDDAENVFGIGDHLLFRFPEKKASKNGGMVRFSRKFKRGGPLDEDAGVNRDEVYFRWIVYCSNLPLSFSGRSATTNNLIL